MVQKRLESVMAASPASRLNREVFPLQPGVRDRQKKGRVRAGLPIREADDPGRQDDVGSDEWVDIGVLEGGLDQLGVGQPLH